MQIKRDFYLNQLIDRKHNGMIKIVSGIRRCGKSYLLSELFTGHLLDNGCAKDHIIHIDLDTRDDVKYRNPDTCNEYVKSCIKDDKKFTSMCNELNKHELNHSEEYYYEIRNLDRDKKKISHLADYKRAARTIYLNKACFNGLYRVNSKNEFNVPFGKKDKVNTYDGSNLTLVYVYLNTNNVKILSTDFAESVKDAKKGDFIYFDPPYDSDTSTFNSYTENGFGKEEQKRLAEVFKDLDKRGCYVMLSNYNTSLIKELYKDYNFHYIEAKRNIGAKAKDRGIVEEIIITNFENNEKIFDE